MLLLAFAHTRPPCESWIFCSDHCGSGAPSVVANAAADRRSARLRLAEPSCRSWRCPSTWVSTLGKHVGSAGRNRGVLGSNDGRLLSLGQQQRTTPLQLVVGAGKHDLLAWPRRFGAFGTFGAVEAGTMF